MRSDGRAPAAALGQTINNRYRITRLIGEGGMGVVYEAVDLNIERNVAIKLVRNECRNDDKFMTRFRRELEVTTRLRHPSTIRVFEHGHAEDGRPYMVMELLRGHSLADQLEKGPIPELQALEFALQIAESLSEAHEHGIFHRDLKPDNIFIETVGVSTVIKVLDFGIAGGMDASRLTRAGEVFGTPQYMSPEQCNGLSLDHRTDIYSLGCILFEMLDGRPPFSAESPMATMLKHVRAKVPMPRNVSRETVRVIFLALRKDRTKRIQDCARFAQLLQECLRTLRSGESAGALSIEALGTPGRPTTQESFTERQPLRSDNAAKVSGNLAPVTDSTRTPKEGPRWVLPTLGGGFVALVALMLFADVGSSNATGARNRRKAQHDAEVLPAAAKVPDAVIAKEGTLPINYALIQTSEAGATVTVDDQQQCSSPCRVEIPVGDEHDHIIRIEKPGFRPIIQRWRPQSVTEEPPSLPPLKPE